MIPTALLEDVSTDARWVVAAAAVCLVIGETYVFGRLSRRIKAHGGSAGRSRRRADSELHHAARERRRRGYNAFQVAGSAAAAEQLRDSWGSSGLAAARKAWTLDLVYPVTYALLGALLASLAATYARAQDSDWLASAMAVVAWLSVAAGVTDLLIENPAVAVGLWSSPTDTTARIAKIAGLVKLTLIGVVLLALVAALVVLLVT
jgi:hypothetical protein